MLVVGPAEQDDLGLVFMPVPGPPLLDTGGSTTLAELVAKAPARRSFLRPTTARRLSGNNIRLTQVLEFDPARGTKPG